MTRGASRVGSRVFLNYRRGDTSGHTGRLYDALSARFGPDQVFIDVDNIAIGQDFAVRIGEVLSMVDVVLVVIGMEWLDAHTSDGHRRLDDPGDFVRIEVETALQRGILVVPVLVEGAEMPSAASLPEPLRPLARRNACVLDDRDWRRGVERLVHAIDDVIATGHFQAVDPPQVGDEPEVVDEPDVVGEPEVVDGEPERPGTPLWTRLRVHSRAIAAVAGIAVLVVAGALWLATRPGGGETGGGGGGGTTAAPDTAALVSSIKARMSEQAPGVTFAVESGCSRRAKGKPPPAWADNAVRLTFPVQACGSDLRSKNAFNGGNVFKVAVAKDGRADAAWNDVSASYQSAPDADGVYHSTSGSCNGAKRYGPTVYLIWWIGHVNGACPRAQDDPEWQSVDTALNEAVGSGGG